MNVSLARATLAICLCGAISSVASAQNRATDGASEQRYIATRDAFADKLKRADEAGKLGDDLWKEQERVVADLAGQLRGLIGPLEIKGLSGPGKLHNETLFYSDVGFGALDGLEFATEDDKTHVAVTTRSLFTRWLRAHNAKALMVPQETAAALKAEAFYTQAVSADAEVVKFADLPLAKPAKVVFIYAMLVGRTQDETPQVPNEIFIAATSGGRVFVGWTAAETKIAPIAACDAVRADYAKQAEAAFAAYQASNLKNKSLVEKSDVLRAQGDATFRRCFAERAPKESWFGAVVTEAQALVDRLP
jgi:hypothetical protein